MRQYQTVIVKLSARTQQDEETLTDLLNERELTGWRFVQATALSATRLLVVFAREA